MACKHLLLRTKGSTCNTQNGVIADELSTSVANANAYLTSLHLISESDNFKDRGYLQPNKG